MNKMMIELQKNIDIGQKILIELMNSYKNIDNNPIQNNDINIKNITENITKK